MRLNKTNLKIVTCCNSLYRHCMKVMISVIVCLAQIKPFDQQMHTERHI